MDDCTREPLLNISDREMSSDEKFKNDTTDSEINCDPTKKFVCLHDECYKSFARLDRLIQHERVHTGERPFKCTHENCSRSYSRANHLKRHVEQCHIKIRTPNDVVICEEDGCYKTFVSKDSLKKHLKIIHNVNQNKFTYHCPLENCEASFSKRFQLRHHEYQHKGITPFQCHVDDCGKKFVSHSKLMRHLKSHEGYKCSECRDVFDKWSLLRKHKSVAHKQVVICQMCHRKFKSHSKLKIHSDSCVLIKLNAGDSESETDEYYAQSTDELAASILKLENPEESELSKDFNETVRTLSNISSMDISDDKNKSDNESESNEDLMYFGIPKKVNLKSYRCKEEGCARCYTTLFNLKTHIRVCHSDNQQFVCTDESCKLSFSTKQKLLQHSLLHSNNKKNVESHANSQTKKINQKNSAELSIISKLNETMRLNEKPSQIYDEDDKLKDRFRRFRWKLGRQQRDADKTQIDLQ